jgi:DNA-binding MarR family transcriptional regulator
MIAAQAISHGDEKGYAQYSISAEPSWDLVHEVYLALRCVVHGAIRKYGLLVSEYHTLKICASAPEPPTLKFIASSLGITPAGTTDLVRRLAERGLIHLSPNPADRRSRIATLTPAGRTLLQQARTARKRALRELFCSLSSEGKRGFLLGITELHQAIESRREA